MTTAGAVKASVLMITYNHERFIGQAIESVLAQRVNFPYEIVIADDCSTDGTAGIVRQYSERNHSIVRPLWTGKNLGIVPNFLRAWRACRGRYIAILEGDDYWTNDGKLQQQVDALDEHPEWTMCFQPVLVVYESGQPPHEHPVKPRRPIFTVRDLLLDNPIQTCGVVYRAGVVDGLPQGFEGLSLGDWPMAILHALRGDAGLVDEVMSAYRRHRGGLWSTQPDAWQTDQIDRMFALLGPGLSRELGTRVVEWADHARKTGGAFREEQLDRARFHARHCVITQPFRPYSWRLLLWTHLGRFGRGLHPYKPMRAS